MTHVLPQRRAGDTPRRRGIGVSAVLLWVACVACGGAAEPQPSVTIDASPRELSFVPCNLDGASQTVALTNGGPGVLQWSARTEGPFVVDGPNTGSVPSGASSEVAFRSRIPSSTPLYGHVDGAIVVSTNDPANREVRIPISATATGASIHSTTIIDVGEAPLGGHADTAVFVDNKGDADVDVDVGTPNASTFATTVATFKAVAKSSAPLGGFRFSPTSKGSVQTTVPLTYRGAVCDAPPAEWKLRGTGVDGIAVSPGKLDFGLVDCGATGAPQSVKVTNPTSFSAGVYVTFGSPDRFEPIPSFTVAPGATESRSIVPKAIPAEAATKPNAFGDTLTITTNVSGDPPHVVQLDQTAYGAVLSMPALNAAGRVLIDASPKKTIVLPLTNSGNAPTQVSGSTPGNAAVYPTTSVAAGATVNVTATLTADPSNIGQPDVRPLSYALTGAVCGLDAPQVSMTPFDTAIDVSTLESYDACVLGHTGRLYCGGQNFPGIPAQLPSLTWVPSFSGTRVFLASPYLICVQSGSIIKCQPVSPFSLTVPLGTVRVFATVGPNARFCGVSQAGTFLCVGANDEYQFGNGSTSGPQWTQWEPSLTGVSGATDFAGDDRASLAVAGGQVFGAGSNSLYSLAQGSNDSFVATTPVLLPGLSNVVRVTSVGGQGACALHANGTATCWDQNGLHPINGILDGVEIAGLFGWLCAIRQNGGVRCSDGAINFPNVWDAPNLVTPVQKVTPICALEANGAVTCWDAGIQNVRHLEGFEGP